MVTRDYYEIAEVKFRVRIQPETDRTLGSRKGNRERGFEM